MLHEINSETVSETRSETEQGTEGCLKSGLKLHQKPWGGGSEIAETAIPGMKPWYGTGSQKQKTFDYNYANQIHILSE